MPALVAGAGGAVLLYPDGEIVSLAPGPRARDLLEATRPMVCHRPHVARRLDLPWFPAHDLLELFAFVHPARFAAPTPQGLARALSLRLPTSPLAAARGLVDAAIALLDHLASLSPAAAAEAQAIAWPMARGGWAWGPAVLGALGVGLGDAPHSARLARGLAVWSDLPEVSEHAPTPPPGARPVEPAEARARLAALLGPGAEDRPQQADFADAATAAFQPRPRSEAPQIVLAEAGTGVGKTLGYIAPASLWADYNQGAVWISTHTRNLQRQLDGELDRLYPDPLDKARRVVVRKGRENYLCLLNYQEAVAGLTATPAEAVALGLMARWLRASRDGDMIGGDFPGWLVDLLGRETTLGLADRRGECLFSACEHVNRCFIERAIRQARRARLVVANHALVLVQAALGGLDDDARPTRYVLDEGHHLFDAADSAFSAHLTGLETADLRRWLLGPEGEGGGRSRGRGLARRTEGLFASDDPAAHALGEVLTAARSLPGPGWAARLAAGTGRGAFERFLVAVRAQVLARATGSAASQGPHGLEADACPPLPEVVDGARAVAAAATDLIDPLRALIRALALRLTEAEESVDEILDASTRTRLDGLIRSLERRAVLPLIAWRDMARALIPAGSADPAGSAGSAGEAPATNPTDGLTATDPEPAAEGSGGAFVDWMGLERQDGREVDVGLHRHWIDPTRPLARTLLARAHGVLITSATLRDGTRDPEADWLAAEARVGALHLPVAAVRAAVPSPFDYGAATRVVVVTDVARDAPDQVAAAFRSLFLAAGGGALGLFTAVSRLRAVRARLAPALEAAGLPLYAQHVDAMDSGTLVAVFREEEDACLLGTDALRDGVDVPGRSLRLIVFERVPWPRPTILHRARRAALGGAAYDDRITRLRLKQAFGRLVRRAGDRGVFVMLDPRCPSRLFGAFPPGVTVTRVGLADACRLVRAHVGPAQGDCSGEDGGDDSHPAPPRDQPPGGVDRERFA